ncbi:uncharacterized protein F5Z01DRAFT_724092 [Emericellopsis atlantica]|uniref:SMP-LTD domain-containing protein n=1 Tax=Emericellopsis atlantica TaxID=2614577 RepID=A0A9P8CP36_9HYPO|nr:uncharacterized protein F5Z01DRAFT_724092 [Emericellopsis atlantica]KAG9254143.1 hypothetical protein F5Z01DRAFT_724092 [Emericellopsis atlantica]
MTIAMGSWSAFLAAYLLGGITFIPLVLITVYLHTLYAWPKRTDLDASGRPDEDGTDDLVQPGDDKAAIDAAKKEEAKQNSAEVTAGYFAVCREYTPMGINAKPIERSTPVGSATVAAPSQSVYQTMYRSIFDRKTSVPGNHDNGGGNSAMSQRPRKAGNVFYVVLRHGHLMLFDDEEQIEVRHVISLAHHDISVYSGGDVTPEGELWIKRNALCLSRKQDGPEMTADSQMSKPFYLFSENCSAKEDFYHALLKNQEQTFGATDPGNVPPKPKAFEVKNIITLVQKLHSTEDNVHSRWLNALIGRVFLGVHRTADIESFISEKITKKIARVKKPTFLTNINIQKIDTGDAAPMFNNLRLKDLTVEGECVIEADVKYTGNFRLEVAATVKIDLGTRFKAREVNLVLAVVLKKIEGHVLFKIKPPPSNRVWLSFQTMPKMEMAIEPIVSQRQITYTLILRQIENRIKEVFAETLVHPFWDDVPFFKTEHKSWRGGIFEGDNAVVSEGSDVQGIVAQTGDADAVDRVDDNAELINETRPLEKSHSLPLVTENARSTTTTGLFGRKISKSSAQPSPAASSTSLETKPQPVPVPVSSPRATEPVVGTDAAHAELFKPSSPPATDNASSYMAALQSRSQEASKEQTTPSGTPSKPASVAPTLSYSSASSADKESEQQSDEIPMPPPGRRNTTSSSESASMRGLDGQEPASPASSKTSFKDQAGSLGRNFFLRRENSNTSLPSVKDDSSSVNSQKKNTLAAVTNAAVQARQWGWNAIQRQKEARKSGEGPSNPQVDLSQPMGRGQPLPPPGTPLPGPANSRTKIGPVNMPKRKPVASESSPAETEDKDHDITPPPPPAGRRRRGASHDVEDANEAAGMGMLVVKAPDDDETPGPSGAVDADDTAKLTKTSSAGSTGPAKRSALRPASSAKTPSLRSISPGKSPIIARPVIDEDDDYSGWLDHDADPLEADKGTEDDRKM